MTPRAEGLAFVGRARELGTLEELLGRASSGIPKVVLCRGDAGIGKTRLIAEFARRASAGGAVTLMGSCVELGEGLPYGAFVEALRRGIKAGVLKLEPLRPSARGELERLWPSDSRAAPEREDPHGLGRTPLFESVFQLLSTASSDRPLVLAIDDLHWVDPSSRDLLTFLVRNLESERVLVVAATRTDVRNSALEASLAELSRRPNVHSLDLRPFDREETAALVSNLLDEPIDDRFAASIHRRSDGNPFFIGELVETLREQGETALPQTVREIIMARLVGLSPVALRLAGAAAVIGRDVDEVILGRVAGLERQELLLGLRELVDARILDADRQGGFDYRFRHALTQEVAYRDLLPGEAREYHRLAADVLEARRPRNLPAHLASTIAHHRERSGDPEAAFVALLRAADAAEELRAFSDAGRSLRRAGELFDLLEPTIREGIDRTELLARAAAMTAMTGDSITAADLAREAIEAFPEGGDRTRLGALYERLSEYLLLAEMDGWGEAAQTAADLIPRNPPSEVRSLALQAVGQWHLFAGDREHGVKVLREAGEQAAAAGSEWAEAVALMILGLSEIRPFAAESAVAAARAMVEISERRGTIRELGHAYWNLSALLAYGGRYEEAVAFSQKALARLDDLGADPNARLGVAVNLVDTLDCLGRLPEAEAMIQSHRFVLARGKNHVMWAEAKALIVLHRGDVQGARRLLDAVDDDATSVRDHQQLEIRRSVEVELLVAEGRHDQVRALVEAGRKIPLAFGWDAHVESHVLRWSIAAEAGRAEHARARRDVVGERNAVATGHADLAALEELVGVLPPDPDGRPSIPEGERLTAIAESTRLDGRSDPEAWAAAVAQWDAMGFRYEAVAARLRLAEALLMTAGDRHGAEEVLAATAATAEEIGALGVRRSAEELARRARLRLNAGGAREDLPLAPQGDPYGLTAREREILQLLARGLTNRQIGEELFISPKTAGVHVSNILGKLGASGRVEAATIAHRLGIA